MLVLKMANATRLLFIKRHHLISFVKVEIKSFIGNSLPRLPRFCAEWIIIVLALHGGIRLRILRRKHHLCTIIRIPKSNFDGYAIFDFTLARNFISISIKRHICHSLVGIANALWIGNSILLDIKLGISIILLVLLIGHN